MFVAVVDVPSGLLLGNRADVEGPVLVEVDGPALATFVFATVDAVGMDRFAGAVEGPASAAGGAILGLI